MYAKPRMANDPGVRGGGGEGCSEAWWRTIYTQGTSDRTWEGGRGKGVTAIPQSYLQEAALMEGSGRGF